MNKNPDATYHEIEHRLTSWARSQKDVRALVVVGSRATRRTTHDAFSDLDVLLVAGRPASYVNEADWLAQIEHPWLTYVIQTPLGESVARGAVFREGQVTVDFAVVGRWSLPTGVLLLATLSRIPGLASWLPSALSAQLAALSGMLRAGTRVLVDKDGTAAWLTRADVSWPKPTRPSEREFTDTVHTFWGSTFWTAKRLLRGELWRCAEGGYDVRQLLLQIVEWHAKAAHGWDYETWFRGRQIERWAEPRLAHTFPFLFAGYDLDSQQRALLSRQQICFGGSPKTSPGGWASRSDARQEDYRRVLDLLASPHSAEPESRHSKDS